MLTIHKDMTGSNIHSILPYLPVGQSFTHSPLYHHPLHVQSPRLMDLALHCRHIWSQGLHTWPISLMKCWVMLLILMDDLNVPSGHPVRHFIMSWLSSMQGNIISESIIVNAYSWRSVWMEQCNSLPKRMYLHLVQPPGPGMAEMPVHLGPLSETQLLSQGRQIFVLFTVGVWLLEQWPTQTPFS